VRREQATERTDARRTARPDAALAVVALVFGTLIALTAPRASAQGGDLDRFNGFEAGGAGDLGIGDKAKRGVDAMRGSEADRTAPAGRESRDRRRAGETERYAEQQGRRRREQQATADSSGGRP